MAIEVVSNNPEAAKPPEEKVETTPAPDASADGEKLEASDTSEDGATSDKEAKDPGSATEVDETEGEKVAKGVKKRIDKAVKKQRDAERERDYWRDLAAKSQKPDQPATQAQTQKQAIEGEPKRDDFASYEEYLDARSDYRADKRFKDLEAKQAEATSKEAAKKVISTFEMEAKAFSESTDDYDEVMAEIEDVSVPRATAEVLFKAGAKFVYALAKDPSEYKRICALDPLQAAREIGKFEASLSGAPKKEVKTTKAPNPMSPVGHGSAGPVHKTGASIAKTGNFKAYKAHREAEMKKKRESA